MGKLIGDPGVEGVPFSPQDEALSRRRFAKFVDLTKPLRKTGGFDFEEILKQLPLDGGTVWGCGDTRFHHYQFDVCKSPADRTAPRCEWEMVKGERCYRPKGHMGRHATQHRVTKAREYQRSHSRKDGSRKGRYNYAKNG